MHVLHFFDGRWCIESSKKFRPAPKFLIEFCSLMVSFNDQLLISNQREKIIPKPRK